jgi:hypothetical protein
MAKFQPSKYYADDKDIHDILSSAKISIKKLLSLARHRGIFLSEESPREEVVHYMSKLPFSWSQIQEVMAEVERDDRDEKLTTCKIGLDVHMDKLEQAIQMVRETRGEVLNEDYTVSQTKDGRLQVKVTYSEPDFQRARLIQRRQKDAVLEIEKKGKDFEVRHTQNEKTNDILSQIISLLTPADSPEKLVRRTIELSGIKNHEHRTQFFLNVFGGMEGFQLREVKDLKVDRFDEEKPKDADETEDDADLKLSKDVLKALVRKVALSGENILISPQYQQLTKDGFFISKAMWTSVELAGVGRLFEFEAEFKNAENASGFAYQIRGVYDRDRDGELTKTRSEINDAEKNQLKNALEAAAYASVETVNELQKSN